VVVLFLVFCCMPLAFAADGGYGARAVLSPRALVMLLPVLAAVYIARTATVVSADGIRVRAAFGSRRLAWTSIRGLNVAERSVYAVVADGAVRLPCVTVADLAAVAQASGGRLPDVPPATPKYAPSRRRRR
jgi:hypothetical protein